MAVTREMADLEKTGTEVVVVDDASGMGDPRTAEQYLRMGGFLGFGLSVMMVIALGRAYGAVLAKGQVAHIVAEEAAERKP